MYVKTDCQIELFFIAHCTVQRILYFTYVSLTNKCNFLENIESIGNNRRLSVRVHYEPFCTLNCFTLRNDSLYLAKCEFLMTVEQQHTLKRILYTYKHTSHCYHRLQWLGKCARRRKNKCHLRDLFHSHRNSHTHTHTHYMEHTNVTVLHIYTTKTVTILHTAQSSWWFFFFVSCNPLAK